MFRVSTGASACVCEPPNAPMHWPAWMAPARALQCLPYDRGLHPGHPPRSGETRTPPPGLIPRVARLMASAIRFEELPRNGAPECQAGLAGLGHGRQPCLTQARSFLRLALDSQEEGMSMI